MGDWHQRCIVGRGSLEALVRAVGDAFLDTFFRFFAALAFAAFGL